MQRCLKALSRLNYPFSRFEVIVVVDGSGLPDKFAVESLQSRLNLKLIRQQNAGPASARNNGAASAKGDFLVFIDDDCEPFPDWLEAFAGCIAETSGCAIGGLVINALTGNLYSVASQFLLDYLYTYYNAAQLQARFLTSNNLVIPAERFFEIGKFDSSFPIAGGEDREFCDRWLHHGYELIWTRKAKVWHAHHLTFSTFWRLHYNYGKGAFRFHKARSIRNVARVRIEPLSFYHDLILYPFKKKTHNSGFLLSFLLIVSQVANAAGFFGERFNSSAQRVKILRT